MILAVCRAVIGSSMLLFAANASIFAQSYIPHDVVLGQTQSSYGDDVHRELNQAILIGNYRLVSGVFLEDIRDRAGTMSLSVTYFDRTLFAFQHNFARQKRQVPTGAVVEAILRRLVNARLAVPRETV